MTQNAALRALYKMLDGRRLEYHDDFIGDIREVIFGTGQEQPFLKKLLHRINALLVEGANAIGNPGFEKLKHCADLYSMHVDTQSLNIRVLFALRDNNVQLLLLAFNEKEGKRKTDYSQKIPEALRRLSEKIST